MYAGRSTSIDREAPSISLNTSGFSGLSSAMPRSASVGGFIGGRAPYFSDNEVNRSQSGTTSKSNNNSKKLNAFGDSGSSAKPVSNSLLHDAVADEHDDRVLKISHPTPFSPLVNNGSGVIVPPPVHDEYWGNSDEYGCVCILFLIE